MIQASSLRGLPPAIAHAKSERNAMNLHRRAFLSFAAGVATLPALSRAGWAQSYPTRPARIVVGFPPGTSSDICARLIAQSLSERLWQHFVGAKSAGPR